MIRLTVNIAICTYNLNGLLETQLAKVLI